MEDLGLIVTELENIKDILFGMMVLMLFALAFNCVVITIKEMKS
jgi:hypothetical protein